MLGESVLKLDMFAFICIICISLVFFAPVTQTHSWIKHYINDLK